MGKMTDDNVWFDFFFYFLISLLPEYMGRSLVWSGFTYALAWVLLK